MRIDREFKPKSDCYIEGWGLAAAAVVAGGAIAGSAISANAASSAASTQAGAAENAQAISQQEFNTITGQEQPFMNAGYGALGALNQGMGIGTANPAAQAQGVGFGSLSQPFTAQNFQQLSPAYQFQLQQGQQGVLNSDSSGQGALSGASQKDLIGYNQGMANTSFNNAFNQYQTQQGNIYSRLSNIANLGQNAASNTGQQGTALAGQEAQSATNIGTALAGGQVGQANAISGGISNLGSYLGAYGAGGSSNSSYGPGPNSGGDPYTMPTTGYNGP
jgi:hypothetical protein